MKTRQDPVTAPFQQALMITPLSDAGVGSPASALTNSFTLAEKPEPGMKLTITSLGLYRCFINGTRVGNDELTPGWTPYDLRLAYQTYDVTELLHEGDNRIEIWLADGWLRSQMMWREVAIYNTWGDTLAALAEITNVDGEVLLKTDDQWVSGETPIRKSGIYLGEHYDARQSDIIFGSGTRSIEFDASILVSQETRPAQELEAFKSVEQWLDDEGRVIVDFGQNLAGYVELSVTGQAGDEILVEHSEILGPDRTFDNRNYRTADASLRYWCRGDSHETYKPHFTFMGYRYARITLPSSTTLLGIKSIPVSSVQEQTGTFECDSPLVNRLVMNTLWSQRSNFVEVPTDCPQRDERLGWTGDAQVFAGTACYLHDSHSFLSKWLNDVLAEQTCEGAIPHVVPNPVRRNSTHFSNFVGSTGWGDVIHVLPLTLWEHYGDRDALTRAFPAMQRWIDYVWSISNGPIVRPPREWEKRGFSFGDWLQPSGRTDKPNATMGDDAAATIYLYIALNNTARVAHILGESTVEQSLQNRASEVKSAFAHEFITPGGRVAYNDQSSYALALLHDLVPEQHVAAARKHFIASIRRTGTTIGTGFIGTPALLPALIKIGEPELAAELFLQESVPGWLYQVKQGATTIWERWDAIREDGTVFDPDMNSYNHYAYGAVCQWLFESVAGIKSNSENPGFRVIDLQPVVLPELGSVTATYQSHEGAIRTHWHISGDRVIYEFTIPEGSIGRFIMNEPHKELELNNSAVNSQELDAIGSGSHTISFQLERLTQHLEKANAALSYN